MNATLRFITWGTMPVGGMLGAQIGVRTNLRVSAMAPPSLRHGCCYLRSRDCATSPISRPKINTVR